MGSDENTKRINISFHLNANRTTHVLPWATWHSKKQGLCYRWLWKPLKYYRHVNRLTCYWCCCLRVSLVSQVYYGCLGLGDPLSHKSPGAQRLLSHLRHPVCLELGVVLWFLPALSLDRLLLAGTLSTYLALAHSLDKQDLEYLCVQLKSKMQLLAEPQHTSDCDSGNHKEKWNEVSAALILARNIALKLISQWACWQTNLLCMCIYWERQITTQTEFIDTVGFFCFCFLLHMFQKGGILLQ